MSAPSPEEEDSNEVTFVVEKDEVDALVRRIDELEGAVEPAVYHRVSAVVERYQEFGQLLDPHLEGWIAPLASVLRAQARAGDAADMVLVQRVSRVLHTFATVRGYKTVVKFFPHEARDLEPVVGLLVKSRDARLAASTLEEADELGTAWETRATLILWLSILVLIPFDLVTVDSAVEDAAAAAEAPPVVMRILRLCQDEYLSDPGIVRDRAAYLLARLLTRPDMPVALANFLDWATDALRRAGRDDATTAARGGGSTPKPPPGANRRPPSSCREWRARSPRCLSWARAGHFSRWRSARGVTRGISRRLPPPRGARAGAPAGV